MRQTEHNIQFAFFNAIRRSPFAGYVWATPNGGYRNKITASNMRKEGQMPGVWDVFVAIPAQGYHGMFIEFKRPPQSSATKRLTEAQMDFGGRMESKGYRCEIHTSAGEAFEAVKRYAEGAF